MGCCFSSSQKSAVPSGGRSTGYREQPAPQAVAQTQRREQESSGYQSWGSGRAGGAAVQTQQDAEARAIAAERAAQRQQQFENSAVGRAAYTAVKDVKNPKSTPMHGSRGGGGVDARDWMS